MNSFRNRLDDLAARATADVRLEDPARRAAARRARSMMPGIAIGAICVLIAAVVWVQFSGDDTSEVLVVGDATEPVTTQPAGGACDLATTLGLLRSGLATYDYEPAGSYAEVAALLPDVVSGRVVSAVRAVVNGTSYIELTIADVVDVGGHTRPDVDVIAYQAAWNDGSVPDPLAQPVALDDVYFFGFLTPWSGVRGGWNPGVEGLYVTCGELGPLVAVIEDGRGADDPEAPTIEELARRLGVGPVDAATPDPSTAATPEAEAAARPEPETESAAQREREAEAAADRDGLAAMRDALVKFGLGESPAIEDVPLSAEVALGLGSTIYAVQSGDILRSRDAWDIVEPEGYAGFTGPFSALDALAAGTETEVAIGEHAHCAGPPIPAPVGFEHHLQVSIQPAEGTIDSCMSWFSVDLFIDVDTMTIAAVTLSLFGP